MEKPDVLYHGSPNGVIDEFEPRTNPHRDELPAVYATPHKYIALMFMHKNSGMAGHFGDVPYVILFGSREECLRNDMGGHLYELPSGTFQLNVGKGFEGKEWVSHVPVKPISKKEYTSSIDAIIEQGTQVYILDRSMYEQLHGAKDHGLSLLNTQLSENQKRGVNIRPLWVS